MVKKTFLQQELNLAEHPVEKVGANLRAMMPWIGKKKLVDSDKGYFNFLNFHKHFAISNRDCIIDFPNFYSYG